VPWGRKFSALGRIFITPVFGRILPPCHVFSKADGLSHGWTGVVYIAAKPHPSMRAVAGGKKDKPPTGLFYEIKFQSPKIGMLLA